MQKMRLLFLVVFLTEFARAASPLEVAERERGVRQDTPRQYEYMRVLNANEFIAATATNGWCGAFAKWALLQAGYQAPKSLDVHDWLAYGQPVTTPRAGDLVVFRQHVAFYVTRLFNGQVLILGGAQAEFPGERTSVCQLWVDEADVLAYRRPVPAVLRRRGPLSTDTKRVSRLRVQVAGSPLAGSPAPSLKAASGARRAG
jgi:uncharacterized protein (TIGR02594 family)